MPTIAFDEQGKIKLLYGITASAQQYTTLPEATEDNDGKIVQYTGETTGSLTQGYFYQSTFVSSSASISQTAGTGLDDIAVDKDTFETEIDRSGSYVFSYDNGWKYDGASVTLSDYGITYTETNTLTVSQTVGNDLGTVSENQTTWETQISDAGTYVFTYDGTNWKLNNETVTLSDYGIAYSATSTPASATGSQTSGSGITNISVTASTFASAMGGITGSPITTGNYVFTYDGTTWNYGQYDVSMPSLGITFTEPQAAIDVTVDPDSGVDAWVYDISTWETQISASGTYVFVYNENDWNFHRDTIDGEIVDLVNDYGIMWNSAIVTDPETTVNQTVGSLTIDVDPWSFSGYFADAGDEYTFTFDGDAWSCEGSIQGQIDTDIDLTACGITITGTPASGDTFIVTLTPPSYGPLDGAEITVDYTTALQAGDEITVSYTQGITVPATGDAITAVYVRGVDNGDELTVVYERTYAWQQIDVQPSSGGGTTVASIPAGGSLALANDTVFTGGEISALSIGLPANANAAFICEVDFTSGSTPTTLTYPSGIKWTGDDLTSNEFVPVASRRYNVIFWYDGVNWNAHASART